MATTGAFDAQAADTARFGAEGHVGRGLIGFHCFKPQAPRTLQLLSKFRNFAVYIQGRQGRAFRQVKPRMCLLAVSFLYRELTFVAGSMLRKDITDGQAVRLCCRSLAY